MKNTLVWLGILAVFVFPGAVSAAVIYETDFSSDPEWVTDRPDLFGWDSATQSYRTFYQNGPQDGTPDRYFAMPNVIDPTRSFTLSWRHMMASSTAYGVMSFNIMPDGLIGSTTRGMVEDGAISAYYGMIVGLPIQSGISVMTQAGRSEGVSSVVSPGFVLGRWYRSSINYHEPTGVITYVTVDETTDSTLQRVVIQNPTRKITFGPLMRNIGASVYYYMNPATEAARRPGGAEGFIDDVRVEQDPIASVDSLAQFRIDAVTPVPSGTEFVGNSIVLAGTLHTAIGTKAKLEFEVVRVGEPFTGVVTAAASFVANGVVATATVPELVPKSDHYIPGKNNGAFEWRARAVDERGVANEWVEFGTSTAADFEVNVVPLVSQIESVFPSTNATREWAERDYAAGAADKPGDCGRTIAECGCAITSLVMLGRYYGIDTAINGTEVQPFNIDSWMLANNGYASAGAVVWDRALQYFGRVVDDATTTPFTLEHYNTTNTALVDASLETKTPVIAYNNRFGHYFVLDDKLTSTYSLRDPRWFETRLLDERRNGDINVQDYQNVFSKANVFAFHETPVVASRVMLVRLASPAEIVVTDPNGKRVGLDPRTNAAYTEVVGGTYTREGDIVSSDDPLPGGAHENKVVRIVNPLPGTYEVEVIGTGSGTYELTVLAYDEQGNETMSTSTNTTSPGTVHEYDIPNLVEADSIASLIKKLRAYIERLPQPFRAFATQATDRFEKFLDAGKKRQAAHTIDQSLAFLTRYATSSPDIHESVGILESLRGLIAR